MKHYFFLLLMFLILAPATAQDEVPLPVLHAEDIFAEGVTVLEEIEADNIPVTNYFFTQDGSWRIRNIGDEAFLCEIGTDKCSEALPVPDVRTEYLDSGFICHPYWLEDGLISQSPDRNWIFFSGCANIANQLRIDLYSYNLVTEELLLINTIFKGYQSFGLYMRILDWIDNYTPVVVTGELRSGSSHSVSSLDVRYTDSLNGIANQFPMCHNG